MQKKNSIKNIFIQEIERERESAETFVTSEKKPNTLSTSKDLVLLLTFNCSISVTNALATTKENMCVSTNL